MNTIKNILGGNNIVEYKNFITQDECKQIIKFYDSKPDRWMPICFYNSFGMGVSEPLSEDHQTGITQEFIDELKQSFTDALFDSQGRAAKINSMHAQKWEIGSYAANHSDNSDLDGNPSGWNDNKYASILYLNEDYDGGRLEFRDHNISLKPETGTLLVFPGGIENVHSVTEITGGTRYTVVGFWDYLEQEYTQEQMEWRLADIEKERIYQSKLKTFWKYGVDDPRFETDEEKYAPITNEELKQLELKILEGIASGFYKKTIDNN